MEFWKMDIGSILFQEIRVPVALKKRFGSRRIARLQFWEGKTRKADFLEESVSFAPVPSVTIGGG
jgi:hypothetical protein